MSTLTLLGNVSGYSQIATPDNAGDQTFTLPGTGGTLVTTDGTQTLTNKTIQGGAITSGTSVASTSGTSIDFTGIPSWVKRITVMFSGVSTNGSSNIQIQLGDSGGIETTSYLGSAWTANVTNTLHSTGLLLTGSIAATAIYNGSAIISFAGSNLWVLQGVFGRSDAGTASVTGGSKTLSDTLDRIRITTVNGTDTFDAGTINIMYEG